MATNRTKTLNDNTAASSPGRLALSHARLRKQRPDLYGLRGLWTRIRDHFEKRRPMRLHIQELLAHGDSRAAVVVSVSPLLVAAYSDELDCVVLLRFPDKMVRRFALSVGQRLLTVNAYRRCDHYDPDVVLGPRMYRRWTGYHPNIADFLTTDVERLADRKAKIGEEEWQRTRQMGLAYLAAYPGVWRDGRPGYSTIPATRQPLVTSAHGPSAGGG